MSLDKLYLVLTGVNVDLFLTGVNVDLWDGIMLGLLLFGCVIYTFFWIGLNVRIEDVRGSSRLGSLVAWYLGNGIKHKKVNLQKKRRG